MFRHLVTGRWGRPFVLLAGVAFLVVGWFATTHAFDRSVESVHTIFDNAMPSITYLAELQGTIGELARDMRRLDHETDAASVAQNRRAIVVVVGSLQRLRMEYERFPVYAAEPEARREFRQAVDELAVTAASVTAEPDPAVRQERRYREFYPALDSASAVVRDLLRINAEQASRSARGVILTHETAARRTLSLTICLTLVLLVLWWLLGRQIARTDRERDRRIEDLDSFGGRVAHDLKAPLSTILMATQLMRKDTAMAESVGRSLERIERAATRMNGMIEGLLSFAKAGAVVDADARTPVADVLEDIRTTMAPTVEVERATLTVDVEGGLCARTSVGVFSSIAQNLVRNAVAHLGDVSTRDVLVRARSWSPTTLELEVADTGPGIPDDVKRRLFRPFERGSTTAEGHGLGLATVKRLVDGHGGSISVDTSVGAGTTFRVRLPKVVPARA